MDATGITIYLITMVGIGYYLGKYRSEVARKRIQSCIDNGAVIFNGVTIKVSDKLSEKQQAEIEKEIEIYTKTRNSFKDFPKELERSKHY